MFSKSTSSSAKQASLLCRSVSLLRTGTKRSFQAAQSRLQVKSSLSSSPLFATLQQQQQVRSFSSSPIIYNNNSSSKQGNDASAAPAKDESSLSLADIVSFCKRRGFIYQTCSHYGGLTGAFDYGPLGAQLKKNIRDKWWRDFIERRDDVVGIETPIILHPQVWHKSGHIKNFVDPVVECKSCKKRHRVDHLYSNDTSMTDKLIAIQGLSSHAEQEQAYTQLLVDYPPSTSQLNCCKTPQLSNANMYNLLFHTHYGPSYLSNSNSNSNGNNGNSNDSDEQQYHYLRPETAQGIFVNFNNVTSTIRKRIPFGIGQTGKSFRNEISPRDFIFRMREFEQMELEYFCEPQTSEQTFKEWVKFCTQWLTSIGITSYKCYDYHKDECAHYATQTTDILFKFPFGWSELWGIANRTNFDLKAHDMKPPSNSNGTTTGTELPHVIEPAVGLDRLVLAVICDSLREEQLPSANNNNSNNDKSNKRTVLAVNYEIAPFQFAVFPLQKKQPLAQLSHELFTLLKKRAPRGILIDYDAAGSIGQMYRRHDEIGTPYCITVDYQTVAECNSTSTSTDNNNNESNTSNTGSIPKLSEHATVTIRERDSMNQSRVSIAHLLANMYNYIVPADKQ